MDWQHRFDTYATRKSAVAVRAVLPGYETCTDESRALGLAFEAIGNRWSLALFDGQFLVTPAAPTRPSVSVVFVQSADGNTGTPNPSTLGGGETDKHLIYEGLSRVGADGVMTGAGTIRGVDLVLSVWHPEMVALRAALKRPRHPAQIVVTASGALNTAAGLMFNVPALRVFVLTTARGAEVLAKTAVERPWMTVIDTGRAIDLAHGLVVLRARHDIRAVSCIGGARLATSLIGADLVDDVYLTTSPRPGGEPHTPYYAGPPRATQLVLSKAGRGPEQGVVFEHLTLRRPA